MWDAIKKWLKRAFCKKLDSSRQASSHAPQDDGIKVISCKVNGVKFKK